MIERCFISMFIQPWKGLYDRLALYEGEMKSYQRTYDAMSSVRDNSCISRIVWRKPEKTSRLVCLKQDFFISY